jgi:hypothetical protein
VDPSQQRDYLDRELIWSRLLLILLSSSSATRARSDESAGTAIVSIGGLVRSTPAARG